MTKERLRDVLEWLETEKTLAAIRGAESEDLNDVYYYGGVEDGLRKAIRKLYAELHNGDAG